MNNEQKEQDLHVSQHSSNEIYKAELEAKSKRIGIWSGFEIMPYKWRKLHRKQSK